LWDDSGIFQYGFHRFVMTAMKRCEQIFCPKKQLIVRAGVGF
jgi:hypothetical protein